MADDISWDRRRFLGTAAMTMAAAQCGIIDTAQAQSRPTPPAELPTLKPGTHTSFGALKQIEAGVLHIGYAEAGPAVGPAVILLHGGPYDIHTYVNVAPALASAGHTVVTHQVATLSGPPSPSARPKSRAPRAVGRPAPRAT